MRLILLFLIVMVILFSCKDSSSPSYGDDFRVPANLLIGVFTNYSDSNSMHVSPMSSWYKVDDYTLSTYCGYDVLFHELSLIGYEMEDDCLQARVILRAFSPIGSDNMVFMENLSLDDYAVGLYYSAVMLYYFDDPADSDVFARNLAMKTRELYDDMFDFSVHYDNPALFVRDGRSAVFEYYHYSVGAPLFLGLDDIKGYSHLIIMQKDNIVLVHKAYAPEQLLRIRP
ncbi:MAG: hypothetical protein ACMXYL_03270 [Candidatus Woesearchaeota archaeon]